MLNLSLTQIASVTNAKFTGGEAVIHAVTTDTRDFSGSLPDGCLFIALQGENFNGHEYVSTALEQGAAFAVVMEDGSWPEDKVLRVNDTRDALMSIAGLHRQKLNLKIAAVTGSVGKTTTKEMIACVLESAYKSLKTAKNLNNEVGLSHTLLRLDESIEAAVVEMGADGPGQISKLSKAARPDVAVITGIGVSHIEAFLNREGILAEKMSVCDGLKQGSDLILCGDNDLLKTVKRPDLNIILYGIENADCAVRAQNISEYTTHTNFEILWDGKRFDAQIPCFGRHNVLNALSAFSVGMSFGIAPNIAVASLKNYRPEGMRQKIVAHNSYTVIEDCYNASPDSMRAALETLGGLKCDGKRIAVLSDMLELGEHSGKHHLEVGRLAAQCGIDCLLCTGARSYGYVEGASQLGLENSFHYGNQELLLQAIRDFAKPGDIIWFKASRGMKLEQVIEKVYAL